MSFLGAEQLGRLVDKFGKKVLLGIIVGCVVLLIGTAIGLYFALSNRTTIGAAPVAVIVLAASVVIAMSLGVTYETMAYLRGYAHTNDEWQIDYNPATKKREPGFDRRISDPGFEARYAAKVAKDTAEMNEKSLKELEAQRAAREVYDRQQNPHGY